MINYTFDKKEHTYYCYMKKGDKVWMASATCSPEDYNYESNKIGYTIAEYRATIKYLRQEKNNFYQQYLALKNLKDVYETHSEYNEDDKLSIILRKRVHKAWGAWKDCKFLQHQYEQELHHYLNMKEQMRERMRKKEGNND